MAAYCASKAGVEQFANVLRLEARARGVTVGTAHPIWIDTDLVRDIRDDLPSFRATLRRLPWPLSTVVPVEQCVEALLRGIERRKRKVYVPRSLALVQALRPVVLSGLSDALITRFGGQTMVGQMEDEVRQLGPFLRQDVGGSGSHEHSFPTCRAAASRLCSSTASVTAIRRGSRCSTGSPPTTR